MAWGFPGWLLPAVGSTDLEWGPQHSPLPALAGGLCLVVSPPALLPLGASSHVVVATTVAFSLLEVAGKSLWMFHWARWLRRGSWPPSPGVVFGAVAAMICQPCLKAPVPLHAWHARPGCWLLAMLQPCGQRGTALSELLCGRRAAEIWLPAAQGRCTSTAYAWVPLVALCHHDAAPASLGVWLAPWMEVPGPFSCLWPGRAAFGSCQQCPCGVWDFCSGFGLPALCRHLL